MSFSISRRALAGAGVALASGVLRPGRARATEPEREVSAIQDFDELWRTLGERYCYFEEKTTDWAKVREIYRPLAARATTLDEFSALVGRVLDELYDAHTHLSDPPAGSPRGRKVRAPQGKVVGNAHRPQGQGKCHREQTAGHLSGKGETVG